jgi:hypothetical protein
LRLRLLAPGRLVGRERLLGGIDQLVDLVPVVAHQHHREVGVHPVGSYATGVDEALTGEAGERRSDVVGRLRDAVGRQQQSGGPTVDGATGPPHAAVLLPIS